MLKYQDCYLNRSIVEIVKYTFTDKKSSIDFYYHQTENNRIFTHYFSQWTSLK